MNKTDKERLDSKTVLKMIELERTRQITIGYMPDSDIDNQNTYGMCRLAGSYLEKAKTATFGSDKIKVRSNLLKAAALIVAEIEILHLDGRKEN